MRALIFFIFSQAVWANTLLETETAMGIANTLQGANQVNPQQVVNQATETINNHESVHQQQMNSIDSPPPPAVNNPIEYHQPVSKNVDTLDPQDLEEPDRRDMLEATEEYFKTEKFIQQPEDDKRTDYKASTQIFYKKDCLPSQKDCKRNGAVLTNIKSVIFNYAHSRGSFSEKE